MWDSEKLMVFLRALGWDRLAWSLRKFHTPVANDALVLEVGSGGDPYPRANVLVDAYEETRERHWVPLTSDRPTVLAFGENLPFKDKAFDYVIASHVLEHSKDPDKFISELQRVAKAGYIEVPDAFFERVNPYKDHRLEITNRNNKLIINKKKNWIVDQSLVELYEDRVKQHLTTELMPKRPFDFHVRYYWKDTIAYEVVNPDATVDWCPPSSSTPKQPRSFISKVKERIRLSLSYLISQTSRNRYLNIVGLLRCLSCSGSIVRNASKDLCCAECGKEYTIKNGVFVMNTTE